MQEALRSPRAVGLYDQALASLVTFGQTLAYARVMASEQFGLFAMTLAALLVAQMLQRTLVVLPMIVSQSEQAEPEFRGWRRVNGLILALSLGLVAAVASAALLAGARPEGTALVLCATVAIALPPVLVYEFTRRVLYLQQRRAHILRLSAANFLLQGAGLVLVIVCDGGALLAVAAMALAGALAAAVGWSGIHWGTSAQADACALAARYRADMAWNLAAAVPYAGFNTAMPMLLGFLSGPAAAGMFTATRLLLAPVTTLIAAVDSVDKPRAARSLLEGGGAALRRSLLATLRSLLLLGGVYLLLAGLFADEILRLLLGADYPLLAGSAWAWSVVGLLMMAGQPLETGLLVLRRTRWYFWTRFSALVVAMLPLTTMLERLGYAAGIVAMAAGWLVAGLAAAGLLRRALRELPR